MATMKLQVPALALTELSWLLWSRHAVVILPVLDFPLTQKTAMDVTRAFRLMDL